MLKVGLTGGVACGKSTVGEIFVRFGAHLVKADEIAHELMSPGHDVYDGVVAAFGVEILDPDGTINRPKLADKAFPTGRIQELNAIVHPAVIAAQEAWMEAQFQRDPKTVAIVEAALMLESGSYKRFDRMITVVCTFEQKIERYARRHNLDLAAAKAEVERRMKAQASDQAKIKISDYVVDNSGPLSETEFQVERIWGELQLISLAHVAG
jgi:dephospho-CoA kinase